MSFSNSLSSAYHSPLFFLAHDCLSENKTTLFTPISVTGTMGESTQSTFFVLIGGDLVLLAFPFFASLESPLRRNCGTLCSISAPHTHLSPESLCAGEFSLQAQSDSWLYSSAVENSISCLKRNTKFLSVSQFICGLSG